MPYIQTGAPQKKTRNPGIKDVYHSGNVFANNVEIALWQSPQDTAAFLVGLSTPDVTFILEQADVDSVDSTTSAAVESKITSTVAEGVSSGVLGDATSSPTTSAPLDASGSTVDTTLAPAITGELATGDWSKFNSTNIPYDTLMLTPKTSLATFTTKAALWNNQPTPMGPTSVYGPGSRGANKFIIDQDYFVGGRTAGKITVPQILHNLANLAKNIYEPLKAKYPNVIITNTFRQSPPGGKSKQAQHGVGMAMDVVFPGVPASGYYDIAVWIRDNLPIDQLLQEKAGSTIWLHISHYSGYGYQVSAASKIANCIVSPVYSFTPGLSRLT